MYPLYCMLLLLSRVMSQDASSSSKLLSAGPLARPFNALDIIERLNVIKPTRQGPVLFPNDAPPPPRPPLIVTSRPLTESIARSELAVNNTVASQSQYTGVTIGPYLAREKGYRPFGHNPSFEYNEPTISPYLTFNHRLHFDNIQKPVIKHSNPVYKTLTNHAVQQVLGIGHRQEPTVRIHYQKTPSHTHHHNHHTDKQYVETSSENDNQNYAFSYRVKDKETGDDFSHSQKSSGSATNGEYTVLLPDGRKQTVTYTADENGYKADVKYEDESTIKHEKLTPKYNVLKGVQTDLQDYYHKDEHIPKYQKDRQANNFVSDYFKDKHAPKYDVLKDSQKDKHYTTDYKDDSLDHDHTPNKLSNYGNNFDKYKVDYVSDVKPIEEKSDYSFDSQEYNDYSTEYNSEPQVHVSKYVQFTAPIKDRVTVKPSFEELKPVFLSKNVYKTAQNYDPVQINVASTVPSLVQQVSLIPKPSRLYTDVREQLPALNVNSPRIIQVTTPSSYLESTIASLKNKVHLAKPILTDNYIAKIKKYFNFD